MRVSSLRQRLKLTKIASFTIILITLLAVISASVLAITLKSVSPKERADTLFLLLEKANTTVTYTLDKLKEKNLDIPQNSLNAYSSAAALAEEAKSLYKLENFSEANDKIIEALRKLKETLTIINENIDLQQSQSYAIWERITLLNSSINRYHDQLKQMENLSSAASTFMTPQVVNDIVNIKTLLNNASSSLSQRDFNAVTGYLDRARNLFAQLTQALMNWGAELKTSRLESYIIQTEDRLIGIRQEATAVSNTASITALNQAQTQLTTAKDYLQKQMLNQTVAALVDAKQSEDQAIKALTPTPTSNITSSIGPSATTRNTTSPTNTGASATVNP